MTDDEYLEALFAAHPGWREDHERRSQPADHPFVLDPGSLASTPWCLTYDDQGRQCDTYMEAHPPLSRGRCLMASNNEGARPNGLRAENQRLREALEMIYAHCLRRASHVKGAIGAELEEVANMATAALQGAMSAPSGE